MNTDVFPKKPVLIVDDEARALDSFEIALFSHGIDNIICCQDSREVMSILMEKEIGMILLDLAMPHITGEQLLKQVTCDFPEIPVVIVTGYNELERAVDCMKDGAFDYLVKPIEGSRIATIVRSGLELRELKQENDSLCDKLRYPEAFEEIITNDRSMLSIFEYVEAIAESSQCVLVTGETGTGKELIVRACHKLSKRRENLVSVNVAGLDDNVFSDTLFGHEEGAYTGAIKNRDGLIKTATEGTLFLDEIGDLSISSQTKLLRLLEEQEYFVLGSDRPRQSTARIIVTTCRDLLKLEKAGKFRKDLFYRLQTHHVHIIPLRKRLDHDLGLLVDHFLTKSANKLKKKKPTPPKELLSVLRTYDFPGNVRELESMIFDAVSRHKSKVLSMNSIKSYISKQRMSRDFASQDHVGGSPAVIFPRPLPTLKETSKLLLREALRQSNGSQTLAAHMLGISPQALNQRLKRDATK